MGKNKVFITARKSSDFWRIIDVKNKIEEIYYTNLENRAEVFQLIEELRQILFIILQLTAVFLIRQIQKGLLVLILMLLLIY